MGDDFTSSTSTTGVLTPGSEIKGAIDYNNDKDWIKIQLTSGVLYKFDLLGSKSSGGTLADPYLSLYDSSGRYLSQSAYNGGAYGDPNIGYIPVSSGNYYVEVSSFYSGNTGNYTLRVSQTGTYTVAAASSSVNEGSTATFNITTTNVTAGTSVAYTISGVSSSDVTGGSLTGTASIGSDGKATVSVPIAADQTTEGDETLTVTVQGQAASTTVKDTSLTPVGTYAVAAAAPSVNEGDTAVFNVTSSNIPIGTKVNYTISGSATGGITLYTDASDIVGNLASGTFVVGQGGFGTISIPILADKKTEGTEILFVTVEGKSALMTVNDTSKGGDTVPPSVVATTPSNNQVKVSTSGDLVVTFSEPIQLGTGVITLKDATGVAAGTFLVGTSSEVSVQGATLRVNPKFDLKIFERYTLEVPSSAVLDLSNNRLDSDSSFSFTTQTLDSLYHFFVVAFAAAPGATYMGQLAEAYNFGLSVKQIVDIFTTKPQFTGVYPEALSNKDFATKLTENIVKMSASQAAKSSAIDDIEAAMGIGWSRGDVIFTVFGNLAAKPKTDPVWGGTAIQFYNQLEVARHLTEVMGYKTTNVPLLQEIISDVTTTTDVSSNAKIVELIGTLPPGG